MSFCSEVIENYKKCKYGNELVPLFFLFYEIKKKSRVLRNTSNCIDFICLSSLLKHSGGQKSLKLLITVIVAKR